MKKIFIIFSLLSIVSMSFGQTKDIETKFLHQKFLDKEFTPERYGEIGKSWNKVLNDIGGYPDFPYDESRKSFVFEYIIDLKGISKEVIYNRILEYSTLTFGNISSVLHYSNPETGKIILKGFFEITYLQDQSNFWGNKISQNGTEVVNASNCYQTYMFTIKDGKCKVLITNVSYEVYYYSSTDKKSINSFFPIASNNETEWKKILNMVNNTKSQLENMANLYTTYIKNGDADYGF